MAKDNNFDEEEVKTEASFKTVTFGGYDKNSVDYYIEELKADHEKEVNELKANVNKLSEAVLSLKTMREVNLTESNKTIDGLKAKNAEYESEIESLKEQADALIAQTNKECDAQHAEMTAKCEAMEKDTTDRCNALETETNAKCKQMYDETEATCASLKEQAYNDSERTRNKAHEAAEALSAKTDYECRTQKENAQKEAEAITNKATSEAYVLRKNVKKECDAVSKYMGELLAALDGVVDACCVTKDIADKAFTGLKSEATSMVSSEDDKEAAGTEDDKTEE